MIEHATLREAIIYFAGFQNCRQFMIQRRCGTDGKVKSRKNVRDRKMATGCSLTDNKEIVLGMVGRYGCIRAIHLTKRIEPVFQKRIRQHAEAESAIFTDALRSYERLDEFRHEVVDHAVESYADSQCHENLEAPRRRME
jgi:hypothetical protein